MRRRCRIASPCCVSRKPSVRFKPILQVTGRHTPFALSGKISHEARERLVVVVAASSERSPPLLHERSYPNLASGTRRLVGTESARSERRACERRNKVPREKDGRIFPVGKISREAMRRQRERFFKQAVAVVGHTPASVTIDGHRSSPRAIRETMGNDVQHRTNTDLNNRLEPGPPWYPHNDSIRCAALETREAAARFCCDARRTPEVFPSALSCGRSDLPLPTTTGFPRPSCRLASTAT